MSAINASQILYGNPRFFIQPLETPPTIKNLAIKFVPNALFNGGLAAGFVFIASTSLPAALITGGAVALITLVASAILHIQLIRQPYDASLLERIPDPSTEANEFKNFIHLLATNFHFAEAAKRKFSGTRADPNSYGLDLITWAPQLEALRLAHELNDVELKTSCEKFLGERLPSVNYSFIKSYAIACCFEASHWQEKILQSALNAYSGYNRELTNFLEEHKESIKTFHLNHMRLPPNRSLALIKEKAPHLTSFTLTVDPEQANNWNMSMSLPLLGELTKLRHLRVLGVAVDDFILSTFLNLTDLEELDIDCSHLTSEGINLLAHFPNLKRLTLRGGAHLSLENFDKLGQLRQLEHLELTNFVIGNEQLQRLAPLPQLKSLAFSCDQSFYNEHANEFNYARLSLFPHLEKLAVAPSYTTEETIAALSQLTRLKSLSLTIRNANHPPLASLFRNLPDLEELNLADSYLNHSIEPFLSLPYRNLKLLDLTNTRINVNLLDAQNFPQLEILKAKDADMGNGISNLNGFSHLKLLDLSRSNLTDDQVSTLVQLSKLEALDLSLNEDLSEQTIEHIARHFKNLKEFYWTMKSNKGTGTLQSLNKLQGLEKIGLRNFDVPSHYAASPNRIERLICSAR